MNIQYRNSQNSLLTSLTHLFRKSYVNNYNSRRCGQKTPRATNSLRRRAKTKGSPQLEDEGEKKNPSLDRNFKEINFFDATKRDLQKFKKLLSKNILHVRFTSTMKLLTENL